MSIKRSVCFRAALAFYCGRESHQLRRSKGQTSFTIMQTPHISPQCVHSAVGIRNQRAALSARTQMAVDTGCPWRVELNTELTRNRGFSRALHWIRWRLDFLHRPLQCPRLKKVELNQPAPVKKKILAARRAAEAGGGNSTLFYTIVAR